MDDTIENLFGDTPVAIEPLVLISSPNEPVIIYEGEFALQSGELTVACIGNIQFQWMPSKSIVFITQVLFSMELKKLYDDHTGVNILVDGNKIGTAVLVSFNSSSLMKTVIWGQFRGELVMGDKTINVTSVRFEVVNLKPFLGDSIRRKSGISRGRLSFAWDKFDLIVDQTPELKSNYEILEEEGGYHLTATANLTKNDGAISFDEVLKLEKVFAHFFSFISGAGVSPAFFTGLFEGEQKWRYYTVPEVDQFQSVLSWAPAQKTESYPSLMQAFVEKLYGNHNNSWLVFAIHWYTEANKGSGGGEAAVMMIQCALELLYNHVVIEERMILKGDDAANLSAANKFRLLLNTMSLEAAIPATMTNAADYCKAQNLNFDGPDLLVDIRNAIVHGQEQKRKRLLKVPAPVIGEVLHLSIFYVERIICKLLDYKGYYFNRTTQAKMS